jgi:hypothetical protein
MVSAEKNLQRDLLKLYAYGTLANMFLYLGTKDAVDEDEAKALLALQEDVVKEFDKTLQPHLDEASMKAFRAHVDRYKFRIVRMQATHILRKRET